MSFCLRSKVIHDLLSCCAFLSEFTGKLIKIPTNFIEQAQAKNVSWKLDNYELKWMLQLIISIPSTKTLLKTYKLSANPSVFNGLKMWNAGTSDGTFWNNKYIIKGIPFFSLPALAVTLAGPIDKYGTYMSSAMKTKRNNNNNNNKNSQ